MHKNDVSKLYFDVIPASMRLFRTYIEKTITPELTLSQFRVLANLNRGMKHVCEIANLLGVSQPAISKMVDGLVNIDLVSRHPFPNDRRVIELRLTKKGKSTFQRLKKQASKNFAPNLDLLDDDELEELFRSLTCLETFINKVKDQ